MGRGYRWNVEGWEPWEEPIAKKLVDRFKNRTYISRNGAICDWRQVLKDKPFEDLMQEVSLHWHSARNEFNSSKNTSKETYMWHVIENKLRHIIGKSRSSKRDVLKTVSLDQPISDKEDSPTFLDILSEDKERASDLRIKTEIKIDVSETVSRLNPVQRRICHLLGEEGLNIKKTSEVLKIPRSTLYGEIKRIRKVFENAKLREYLK